MHTLRSAKHSCKMQKKRLVSSSSTRSPLAPLRPPASASSSSSPPMRTRRTPDMASSASSSAASLSLSVGGRGGFTLATPPQGLRNFLVAGAALVSGLVFLVKRTPADAVRKRVVRRLDRIAPKRRFDPSKKDGSDTINTDCPVCLCEFSASADRPIRVLPCRHALCSGCLEAWAVHCTKAHLNPARFGITRGGQVVSWTPGPKCPLCCARLNCVPDEDLRQAIVAAIHQRGAAISNFIAYQARSSSAATGGLGEEDGV